MIYVEKYIDAFKADQINLSALGTKFKLLFLLT
jgi:hypothetical protein